MAEKPESYMSEFRIRIADRIIRVWPVTSSLRNFCKDYLLTGDSLTTDDEAENDPVSVQPDAAISLTEADVSQAREHSKYSGSYEYYESLELACQVATKLLEFDTVVFHSSCIAIDGAGICFTAPSGTGKSTHANLWKRQFTDRIEYINDDKPFLKIADDGVTAYGSPWNGTEHLSANTSVQIKVICILYRSDTNHVEPLSPDDAYPYLFERIYKPHEAGAVKKILELTDKLSRKVDLYSLGCNMAPEAAVTAYEGIKVSLNDQN